MITVRTLRRSELTAYTILVKKVIGSTAIYSPVARVRESKRVSTLIRYASRTDHWFLIAHERGQSAGFCLGEAFGGVAWIDWIGVDSSYRRSGVARALLAATIRYLKRQKVSKVWFDTRTNNKASITLARSLGCRRIGTVKKHWYGHDYHLWEKRI